MFGQVTPLLRGLGLGLLKFLFFYNTRLNNAVFMMPVI